jgi:chemotaxis protein methyltransferase CheR
MLTVAADNLTEAEFTRLADVVYRHCGINLHEGKMDLVRARLAKLMRVGGFGSPGEYLDHVMADASGEEFTKLIDGLSTNLTSFFRERNHFDYLEHKFLPTLLAAKRQAGQRRLRGWSAGCSSGEEPYSLAMVLLESVGSGDWDVKLLATDISTRVLAHGQRGVYEQKRTDGLPPALRTKYLSPSRAQGRTSYEVSPALREVISFRHLNLMQPWPFSGPFDFIFCRNVMIYFDKPTQQKLVGRYFDLLSPGGLLFTGHSESLTGITHGFRYEQPTIYAKPGKWGPS